MNRDNPLLIIASPPRSGSSLTTCILQEMGVFLGVTKIGDRWNRCGYFENVKVSALLTAYLRRNDIQNLGKKFQPVNLDAIDVSMHREINNIFLQQGYSTGPRAIKDPKVCLCWKVLHTNFPNAIWLMLNRDKANVLRSYKHTPFMDSCDTLQEWEEYLDKFETNMNAARKEVTYYDVCTDGILKGDLSQLHEVIKRIL